MLYKGFAWQDYCAQATKPEKMPVGKELYSIILLQPVYHKT